MSAQIPPLERREIDQVHTVRVDGMSVHERMGAEVQRALRKDQFPKVHAVQLDLLSELDFGVRIFLHVLVDAIERTVAAKRDAGVAGVAFSRPIEHLVRRGKKVVKLVMPETVTLLEGMNERRPAVVRFGLPFEPVVSLLLPNMRANSIPRA